MDFHGMNRKNLQILCKKHGIPANLKNVEMANRLASLFQKEDEETVTETKISPEEEEEEVVASRKAKKVRFSPESDNQVFEFTRSVKKNVRAIRRGQDGAAKALKEGGSVELRRSRRSVCKGITVDGPKGDVEAEKGPSKVTRRSKRVGSCQEEGKDTDLIALEQFGDGRRSTRLAVAARIEKSCVEGGTSKAVALLPAAKRSKRIGSSGGSAQEEGKDTDLNASERFEGKDIQGGRRSTRLAAKTEKPCVEGETSKSVVLLPTAKPSKVLVDVANKDDEKETGEAQHRKDDDSKVEMVRRRSRRFVSDIEAQGNTQEQRRSVRLKASVANPLMCQAKNDSSVKASRVVKGTLADKKTDGNLVKSKRVTRTMKRDRPAEPGVDSGTASNQSNLTPKKTVEEFAGFEQEEACSADVKAGGSSKKSKKMTQECIKDKPQGITESGMIIEKVFDSTLDKAVDSPQRSNIREINCEPTEGECDEKLERDTVSTPLMEEDKGQVSLCSLSSSKDMPHVPTSHIIVKDIASPVIAEGSSKTKEETLVDAPESELKEHSSIAKLANVEEILENSTGCWEDIHSSKDDEKGSLEKDVQAEDMHGNVSECNTEKSSAEDEMEISKIGVMNVAHCVHLTQEKLLGEYAQLEPEEAERPNVEFRSSSQKMKKTMGQEFVEDKPQGMAEDSPSTSETKATELSVTVLDSPRTVSVNTSAVRNSHELDSERLEEKREEKYEQATVLLTATKKVKGEASTLSEMLIERSEVSINTLSLTPTSELKEHSSVAELAKVEAILDNSDEKGSLEIDVQAEKLHVNFSECNTENISAVEETETNKVGCTSVNLTPGKLLDAYPQLVPEKAEEPLMLSENVLDSTSKVSVDISLVNNTQELSSELMEAERGEKQEQDIVLMAATKKDEEEASSLFMQTTPPPSIQKAVSNPESELSVPTAEEDIITDKVLKSAESFVAKFAETDANLENPAECWNESLSSIDDDIGSIEKEKQLAMRHGNFSEYNAENSSAQEQADIYKAGRISDGHFVDRETLDEVKDEILTKSVQTSEGGCKPNALELSGSLSTDFASLSPKEVNVSGCLDQDEMKALSQPTPINTAASNALDRSSLFTTPERNLMLMEQFNESGKILAPDTVTQRNDEEVESVVFTTPEKLLLLGDSGLYEVGKEEEHTTTDFPDDLNTTQNEDFDEEERIIFQLHDESNIAPSPLSQSSVGDFKEDRIERNEEYKTVELHCEYGACTGPARHAPLVNSEKNSGGNKAMQFYEESVVFTGLEEIRELFGDSGKDKAREDEVKMDAQFYEEAGLSTEIHKDLELGEVGWLGVNNTNESGILEGHLLYGDSEQKNAVKPSENAAAEFHDESAVPNFPKQHPLPEESELEEAKKSEENNALECQAGCNNFIGANVTAKSHDMSDVLTVSESHSLIGDFEPDGEENKDRENKIVVLLGESNISTNEESGQDEKIKYNTAATCEESFVFISPERQQQLGNSEPHTAGKQEQKEVEFKNESAIFTRLETRLLLGESGQDLLGNGESSSTPYQSNHASSPKVILKDDSVLRESQVAAPDFRENTIADFSGSIASKVSYSHEFSAGEVTAGAAFMQKLSQVENVASKQNRENSPHVDSVHHFDFDTMGADTIMDAERKASFSSHVLALPAKGNSQITGEISNPLEVARTCSLVSEEPGPSTDIQNQTIDAVEELAVTGEHIDARVPNNTQNDSETNGLPAEGDSETIGKISSQLEVTGTCSMVSEKSTPFMDVQNHINDALEEELAVTDNSEARVTKNVDSSGGSDVSGIMSVLAGTEDEQFDTAFEKDISLAPDESTLQKNRNAEEIAADDEMLKREATSSPEEILNESSEKQVRREPISIYRTQVKPKRHHDMKENAPNSKIVDNLNVTAPRTSKRQPLQDLRKY